MASILIDEVLALECLFWVGHVLLLFIPSAHVFNVMNDAHEKSYFAEQII